MRRFDIDGVFYFMAAAAILLALVAAAEDDHSACVAPATAVRVLAPQAASLAHDPLDPSDGTLSPAPVGVAADEG